VPSPQVQESLLAGFGQAWFDTKKSIWLWGSSTRLPFWILSFWGTVTKIHRAKKRWADAAAWLAMSTGIPEEVSALSAVQDIWRKLLSNQFLSGAFVDSLLVLLSRRCNQRSISRHLYESFWCPQIHSPPIHWAACAISFSTRRVQFGDSLGHELPNDIFEGLRLWHARSRLMALTVPSSQSTLSPTILWEIHCGPRSERGPCE